jgi:hypothetical protein
VAIDASGTNEDGPISFVEDDGSIVWGHRYKGAISTSGRVWFRDGLLHVVIDDQAYSGTISGHALQHLIRSMIGPVGLTCGACGGDWKRDHDKRGACLRSLP